MTREERLNRIKTCLYEAFGNRLEGVVLYGSEVRGKAGPESDIDVLVLLQGPVDYGRDLRVCIHATYPLVLEWERHISLDPVDMVEYEKAEWPLYQNAGTEGIMV